MRVSLTPDNAEFVKQIAELRRFLNRMETRGGQDAMKARLLRACLVEFLNALRAELRTEGYDPRDVLNAVAELVGNLVASTVQSMFDGVDARKDIAERMFGAAFDVMSMTMDSDGLLERDAATNADTTTKH